MEQPPEQFQKFCRSFWNGIFEEGDAPEKIVFEKVAKLTGDARLEVKAYVSKLMFDRWSDQEILAAWNNSSPWYSIRTAAAARAFTSLCWRAFNED